MLLLAGAGYVLSTAKSGSDGLMRAVQDRPELIMIDLALPDLSGDAVAVRLKEMTKTKNIPIILYQKYDERTASSVVSRICQNAGIEKFVESDDPQKLVEECRDILG